MSSKRNAPEFQRDLIADRLRQGVTNLIANVDGTIGLTDEMSESLVDYIGLLHKWNQAFNLTAVRDPVDMVCVHILDSLAVMPYIPQGRILDVGTGAGLPGLVLALTMPDRNFTLLDSKSKKTRFCQQVVDELAIANVDVVQSRVEEYAPARKFDAVIARAFSSLTDFVALTEHLVKKNGQWLAMKGRDPSADLADQLPELQARVRPLFVPNLDAERHLAILARASD